MRNSCSEYAAVHAYYETLGAEVVAESGIATDRLHLGKLILNSLRKSLDHVLQIDANTGQIETNSSVLSRSVACARVLQQRGVKPGDVITLVAPNHLDICVPFYAALYLGVSVMPIDLYLKQDELKNAFVTGQPKFVFCQTEREDDVNAALKKGNVQAEIVTFDCGSKYCSFDNFLADANGDEKDFKAVNLNPADTVAFLIATSGTTGLPKAAAVSHHNLICSVPYFWIHYKEFPAPIRGLVVSTLQWYSGLLHFVCSALMTYTRIQTSAKYSTDHFHDIINTYKPNYVFMSPNLMQMLINEPECRNCDFTCFDEILLGGSAVPESLLEKVEDLTPNTLVTRIYGMSELSGLGFYPCNYPVDSCGRVIELHQYKLIDISTGEEITKANQPGELLIKSTAVFKGYYNNPKATAETFLGEWFRTGDMFYRDDYNYYYYVERIKLLLKYRNNQISPIELEEVISRHPGVQEVAVVGVEDNEGNDLPTACVVRRADSTVTATEICDLVLNSLAESKQLRGGVLFFEDLPMTVSMKINRKQLKQNVTSILENNRLE